VASGTRASSGRAAIGASVPSMSSSSTSGRARAHAATAAAAPAAPAPAGGRAGGAVTARAGARPPGAGARRGPRPRPGPPRGQLVDAREHRLQPVEDRRPVQPVPHLPHPPPPVLERHGQRLADRPGDAVDVERVDEDRPVDLLGGAREAAEQQHPVLVELARHELLRHEVHPVLQRRDEAHVGRAVHPRELGGRHVAVLEHDRRPPLVPPARVERVHRVEHLLLERLVRLQLGARRRRDEQRGETAAQVRRLLEEPVDGVQPLGMPLV
jgi:hypothetical protein